MLLHGSGPGVSGWANYRGNLPVFAEHFRTLVLDFPGFGKSYSCEGSPLMAAPQAVLDFLDGMSLDSRPDRRQLDGRQRRGPRRGEQPRAGESTRHDRRRRPGAVQPDAGRGDQAPRAVRRGPDPRTSRHVDGVDGLRHVDPHRGVRRAAVGGGERPGRAGRRPADVQLEDPQGDEPSQPDGRRAGRDARQDRGARR